MMLIGRISKAEGHWWFAECEAIGAYTQGASRKDAVAMLADCIKTKVDRADFEPTVTELGTAEDGSLAVLVSANTPAVLAIEVLKYQREKRRLTLADVAKKLGVSSRSAFASYEQGKREPSLSKYVELLAAVAPDLALILRPRTAATKAKKRKAASR